MRINIILGPFLPSLPGPAGAVEKLWQGLAREFAACGNRVCIIERDYPDAAPGNKDDNPAYIRVKGYDRPRDLVRALCLDAMYTYRALCRAPEADATISNTFFLPLPPASWMRAKLGDVFPNVQRMPKGQTEYFSNIHTILATSTPVATAIANENRSSQSPPRVKTVSNPVDTSVFAPANGHAPNKPRTLLYAGRIAKEKGLLLLIEAFSMLCAAQQGYGVKLIIVGPHEINRGGGGERYLNECKALARDLPVEFRPAIGLPDMLALTMREAEIFCYPSIAERGETFGVSVIEAMGCGLVPVVSSLECFEDFVFDEVNGLRFDHRSPQAAAKLRNQLKRLLEDKELFARLRAESIATAQKFSYPVIAESYLNVLNCAVGQAQ